MYSISLWKLPNGFAVSILVELEEQLCVLSVGVSERKIGIEEAELNEKKNSSTSGLQKPVAASENLYPVVCSFFRLWHNQH